MNKFPCPIPDFNGANDDGDPDYYVTNPARWLGKHAIVKDEAIAKGEAAGLESIGLTLAVSLALAEDFRLPGLDGKPENWDFAELPLELITWVNFVVWGSFHKDFTVKKNYLLASLNGNVKTLAGLVGEIGIT